MGSPASTWKTTLLRVRDGNRVQIRQTGDSTITLSGVLRLCAHWGADALLMRISKIDTRGGGSDVRLADNCSRKSGRQVKLDQKENIPVSSGHAGKKTRSQIISQDPLTFLQTGLGEKKGKIYILF